MATIFLNALRRARGSVLGWGLALGVLGGYLMQFYDTLADQQAALMALIASYPPELLAFFGDMPVAAMFTPEGYLGFEFFSYLPLILGIFAVLSGSGALAADEENGTLDLIAAQPVSRTAIFLGRWLALLAATLGILVCIWLGLVIGRHWSSIDLTAVELARPFLSLGAVLIFFGSLGLLLSLLLPSRRVAATAAGLLLTTAFFVTSLARIDDRLEPVARFSPLNYYQAGDAITDFNTQWFGGLLAVSLIFTAIAWWRFERRDIRVAGEGGWRLRWPGRPAIRPEA